MATGFRWPSSRVARLFPWLGQRRAEREIQRELDLHLELEMQEQRKLGMSRSDAARAARVNLGNVSLIREDARAVWGWHWADVLSQDARRALRSLFREPELNAVVMLALAIGLTTATFTVADGLLFRPVPFDGADRLAHVSMMSNTGGRTTVSPAVFRAWRESPVFESVESATTGTALIDTATGPVARASARVTPGLFQMLDVTPVLGRLFQPDEGRPGATDRVLLSEDLWRSTFGADRSLVGRRVTVDGESLLVVGIVPADFRFPSWDTVLWRPVRFERGQPDDLTPTAYVRSMPDIPDADTLRVATDVAHDADPATSELRARSRPLSRLVLNEYYELAVPLLFGGAGLVFLVLCANASGLLIVRLARRRKELAVCAALGASRRRLVGQTLMESAVLGGVGSLVGLGVAWLLVTLARVFLPDALLLRTLNPLNLDTRAFMAASTIGVLATLIASALPAWVGTKLDPAESLKTTGQSSTQSRTARSMTRGLVVAEMVLACALLAGASVLVRSFMNLNREERGLDSRGVVTAWFGLPRAIARDAVAGRALTSVVEAELRTLPGVRQVALSYGLPPNGGGWHSGDWRADIPGAQAVPMEVNSYSVGNDFFDLYRIPLLRGRTFQSSDDASSVIVGERLAASLWPGVDAVGRSFTDDQETRFRVVGVARETHYPSTDLSVNLPEYYQPFHARTGAPAQIMVNLRCDPACPDEGLIRQRLVASAPSVEVVQVGPLDAVYLEQLAGPRAAAALAFVFAFVAIVAAAGGLFAILSQAVGARRRELAIRMAVGASSVQIRRLVLRDALLLGGVSLPLGAAGGWVLARGLASLQYGVTLAEPAGWLVVIGVFAATTLLAACIPAHRATGVDPVSALKSE